MAIIKTCVSYKKQELLIIRKHQGPTPVFDGVHVAHPFSNLCYNVILHLIFLRPVSRVPVSLQSAFLIATSVFSNA